MAAQRGFHGFNTSLVFIQRSDVILQITGNPLDRIKLN